METPNITLDQWRALIAVVDAGGYAQAAVHLHKSQSSVSYAVQKIESLLGVEAFQVRGRKAELTSTGQLLVRRARALVDEAASLERAATQLSAGWEAEVGIAVEILFPTWVLLTCLHRFGEESPHTRIEVFETVMGGTAEALQNRTVELALTPHIPPGMLGERLAALRFVAAAHPDHPLHHLGRAVTRRDLKQHRHLVVRDTASDRTSATSTIDVEQRWTFSTMATSIRAACMGHGFAWYSEEKIRDELASGQLKPLPLRGGAQRVVEVHLVFADRESAGPATLRLAEIIREETVRASADECDASRAG